VTGLKELGLETTHQPDLFDAEPEQTAATETANAGDRRLD
jgi:hypothetical protein